ncbi:MAG TPA: amino acid ABC transporter permease [Rhodopila sp.]|uniref:amino acid ABC transporter permease n=1 Tax=Rhodopila sp. TaxID=2480087 RepID=UPI002B79E667|nr:amino acid ABC transporter permease [Rhodopila sp.]HVY17796.1 amino acid ABC transporter permease [Rhodopila sp.]
MRILLANHEVLLQGLTMTLALTLCVLVIATVFAALLAAGLMARHPVLRRLAQVISEVMRDIPLFVTVMMVYFVAPSFGIGLDPFGATLVGLGAWGAANGSTIIRAGILAVPAGQREASAALGLRPWQVLRLVILPQALRPILPPYLGLTTQLVQATSVGALIGVRELLRTGQIVMERATVMEGGLSPFLLYGVILLIYFAICSALSALSRRLERRLGRHENHTMAATPQAETSQPGALARLRIARS